MGMARQPGSSALAAVLASALVAVPVSALVMGALGAAAPQNSRTPAVAPLDFDPARPERVDGWWCNGEQLMRLEPNGAYQFWSTTDRFAKPAEVGAWRRSNYVLFDLEPYRAKAGTRVPVELVKRDGVTCIARPGMAPLCKTAMPPHVFGDDMLGIWATDKEQILVMENGKYEYRRTGQSAGISQHNGVWRTEGERLILVPETDAVAPISLDARRSAEREALHQATGPLELQAANGSVFSKVQPEPIAAPSTAPAAPKDSTPASPPASPPAPSHGSPPASSPASPPAKPSAPPKS